MRRTLAFAVPGDINQRTGGTIYDKRLISALREIGHDVELVELPGTFPNPSDAEMAQSIDALAATPPDQPIVVDGLAFGAMDTARLDGVQAPLIGMIHHPLGLETGLPADRARFLIERERANLARTRHVFVPSPHTARTLVETFDVPEERVTIIKPGFELKAEPSTPQSPPLILSVGLLADRKGHDVLIRALARVKDLGWHAVIVGKPHEQSVAEALADQLKSSGLNDRLTLAGEVGDAELSDLYGRASIFALATRYEGYGIVFGEALVRGLPIVSCRTGAVPDTVPADCGILVEIDDDAAFAAALRDLLDKEALRLEMSRKARRHGLSLPTWLDGARLAGEIIERL